MNLDQNYLSTIVEELNMMIVVIGKDNTLLSANKIMLEFAGVQIEDVKGMALWDLPWLKHDPDLQNKVLFALSNSYLGESSRFNVSYKHSNGEVHEIDFIVKPVMKDGEPEYFITMGYNITDLVRARKALTERDRRIKAFFDYSSEGYFFLSLPDKLPKEQLSDELVSEVIAHYKLEDSNNRLKELIGRELTCVDEIFDVLEMHEHLNETVMQVISQGSITLKRKIKVLDQWKHLEILFVAIYDENKYEGSFGIVRDITEQVNHIDQMTYLANKDYLTGINNRRHFFYEASNVYKLSKNANVPVTLVMFDIDHFKNVNDTYGHDVGDIVIKDIARIVKENLTEDCIFARYGGEEYIVLMPQKMDNVYKKFEDIRNKIELYAFNSDHKKVHVTVSLGLYQADKKIDSLETCITKADKALYESKQNGRNQSTIFIESIHGESAFDPLTQIYSDVTMRYKLNKSMYDAKKNEDNIWVIYFEMQVVKSDKLLTIERHYKTMALCLKKNIRNTDYVGRIGDNGFMVVLRNVSLNQVENKYHNMVENIEIGFSGMINDVVHIDGCYYNAKNAQNLESMLNTLNGLLDSIL